MIDIKQIESQIRKIQKERELLQAKIDNLPTGNLQEALKLTLEDQELWKQEDRLKDKLLTPELILKKRKSIERIDYFISELNKMVDRYNYLMDNEKDEEKKQKLSDDKWILLDRYSKLQWEQYKLKWEVMSEDEREIKKKAIISMNRKWGNL